MALAPLEQTQKTGGTAAAGALIDEPAQRRAPFVHTADASEQIAKKCRRLSVVERLAASRNTAGHLVCEVDLQRVEGHLEDRFAQLAIERLDIVAERTGEGLVARAAAHLAEVLRKLRRPRRIFEHEVVHEGPGFGVKDAAAASL